VPRGALSRLDPRGPRGDDRLEDHQSDDEREAVVEGVGKAQASRRRFLQVLGAAAATAATSQADAAPWEDFFQQHYKRLTDDEKRQIFARLEAQVQDKYGVAVRISDPKPIDGVEFGYALNLTACVGCRRCEYACAQENNTSRSPELHYIRVLEMDKGTLDVERSTRPTRASADASGHFYMPVQCHQCRDAPCVRACPVNATWPSPTASSSSTTTGASAAATARPRARTSRGASTMAEPTMRPSEINPDQGLLSNRAAGAGVMEKCTFLPPPHAPRGVPRVPRGVPHRRAQVRQPARPNSEVRQVLETKRVYVLHEDAGTNPRFYYYFG
jgi:Fe-S-cluster-containing dehydrogenase component